MQIDLEVYRTNGFEFPNPLREGDRITAIAMSDSSGWERLISGREYEEAEMLAEMAREICDRNPDVIEGHNIFRFDLPYIDERAQRYDVDLRVGRDGSVLRHRQARFQVGDRVIPYHYYSIYGRHVIDTWFLAQYYSLVNRELRRNGLKDVARHFGVAAPQRTYIPGDQASWYFDHDPETLFHYALDDVRETREISAVLSPNYFVQAQIFPYSFQDTALTNEPTKIDRLMLREYSAQGHSIPSPLAAAPVAEKYATLEVEGVSRPVLHCDVTSLHAAVMLDLDCRPETDDLGIFSALLGGVRDLWERGGQCDNASLIGDDNRIVGTIRSGLKVLMDSFHDYLVCATGHFNDFRVAEFVTQAADEHTKKLVGWFDQRGHRMVTVDANGIYVVPPAGVSRAQEEAALRVEVASLFPRKVEFPVAQYRAIFCYAPGNYALLDEHDQQIVVGSDLSPRGLERYRREWLQQILMLLFNGRDHEVRALYERYRDAIGSHRLDLLLLKRIETLRESLDDYQMKVKGGKQHPRGAYEVALRSERNYLSGDQISYYVVGQGANVMVNTNCRNVSEWDPASPDENVDYYKARLRELYERFARFLGED